MVFLVDPLCFVWLWLFIISPVDILKLVDFTSALTQTVDINKWNKSKKCETFNTIYVDWLYLQKNIWSLNRTRNYDLYRSGFKLFKIGEWWFGYLQMCNYIIVSKPSVFHLKIRICWAGHVKETNCNFIV